MIQIQKLTKRYGEATIFEDIDLIFSPATIIGLIGHGLRMNEQLDKVDEIIPKDQKEFRVWGRIR